LAYISQRAPFNSMRLVLHLKEKTTSFLVSTYSLQFTFVNDAAISINIHTIWQLFSAKSSELFRKYIYCLPI